MKLESVNNPSPKEISEIRLHLQEYNRGFLQTQNPRYLIRLKKDEKLIAGLVCTKTGNWLELGRDLMERAELLARKTDCISLSLNTFDFQARAFYEKMGFQTVFTVQDERESIEQSKIPEKRIEIKDINLSWYISGYTLIKEVLP